MMEESWPLQDTSTSPRQVTSTYALRAASRHQLLPWADRLLHSPTGKLTKRTGERPWGNCEQRPPPLVYVLDRSHFNPRIWVRAEANVQSSGPPASLSLLCLPSETGRGWQTSGGGRQQRPRGPCACGQVSVVR